MSLNATKGGRPFVCIFHNLIKGTYVGVDIVIPRQIIYRFDVNGQWGGSNTITSSYLLMLFSGSIFHKIKYQIIGIGM